MKEFKIIQVRRRKKNNTFYFPTIGTVQILNQIPLKDVLEDIWNVCNVSSWCENDLWKITKRINIDTLTITITDEFLGVANSDIIVTDGNKINFAADTFNWKSYSSLKEAKRFMITKDFIPI